MKEFELCLLVQGEWKFDSKFRSINRKSVMDILRGQPDYREGCVRVRLLK